MTRRLALLAPTLLALALSAPAGEADLPRLFADDFAQGADRWQPTDPAAWKVGTADGNPFFSQFKGSKYKTRHRSPFNVALVKDLSVGDFDLTAKVQSTARDYGHRDACLFFGYQDPGHFYYVHLAKQTDDRANQIFIVDGADRKKISTRTTPGTPWDDGWHRVKVVRRVADGTIAVYFDDMKTPAMTATDKTFTRGQVGVGSFDDTANWDDVAVHGRRAAK